MNVVATTAAYDRWLARRLRVIVKSDLKRKHREMSEDPFSFLRASFYRWAQIWPQQCADLTAAPKVLGVGDLHVEQRAYWERLLKLGRATVPPTPGEMAFLKEALPEKHLPFRICHRQAGLGSLGRRRFTVLAHWRGGTIAREAKALTTSAWWWCGGKSCAGLLPTVVASK